MLVPRMRCRAVPACSAASALPLPRLPPLSVARCPAAAAPPAADLDSITKVLEQGAKPTGDCYTWERGGKW